jgi:hypothetical protein
LDSVASDRQKYEPILQGFVGMICYRSIACNSIKIRFGERADVTESVDETVSESPLALSPTQRGYRFFQQLQRAKVKPQSYIWIDPPWSFMQHGELITEAYLCPHYEDIDYAPRFKEWCNLFHPLNESVLTGYEFLEDESLNLFFHDSYQIHVPRDESDSCDKDELWYSQWYARLCQ